MFSIFSETTLIFLSWLLLTSDNLMFDLLTVQSSSLPSHTVLGWGVQRFTLGICSSIPLKWVLYDDSVRTSPPKLFVFMAPASCGT